MEAEEYHSWKLVQNTAKNRLSANSLTHSRLAKTRIRRSTKLFNKQAKKLSNIQTYSQFVSCKKKILQNLEDLSETDESDFDDNDYKRYHDSFNVSSKKDSDDDIFQWNRIYKNGRKCLESENISKFCLGFDNVDRSTTKQLETVKGSSKKIITLKAAVNNLCSPVKKASSKSNSASSKNTSRINNVNKSASKLNESPKPTTSTNKSVVEHKSSRTSSKEVKRNLSSEINNVTSAVSEPSEEDDWNNEFASTNFQAQSTQIFSDTFSEDQPKKRRSRFSLRLKQNERLNQPRDSGIEEDSREGNSKYEGVANVERRGSSEEMGKESEKSDINTNRSELNKSFPSKSHSVLEKDVSKDRSSEKFSDNSNQSSIQNDSNSHRSQRQSIKIIDEQKLTKKYKIINDKNKSLKPITEETHAIPEQNDHNKIENDSDEYYDLKDEGSAYESNAIFKSPTSEKTNTESEELDLKNKLKRCKSPYLKRQYQEMKHLRLLTTDQEDSSEFSEAKESSQYLENQTVKSPGKRKSKKKKTDDKSINLSNDDLENSKEVEETKQNGLLENEKVESDFKSNKRKKKKSTEISSNTSNNNLVEFNKIHEIDKKKEVQNGFLVSHRNEKVKKNKSKDQNNKLLVNTVETMDVSDFAHNEENSISIKDKNKKSSKKEKLEMNNLKNDSFTNHQSDISHESMLEEIRTLVDSKLKENDMLIENGQEKDYEAEEIFSLAKKSSIKLKDINIHKNENSDDSSNDEVASAQLSDKKKKKKKKKKDESSKLSSHEGSPEIEYQKDITNGIDKFKKANCSKSSDDVSANKKQNIGSADLPNKKLKDDESDLDNEMSVEAEQQLKPLKRLNLFESEELEDSEKEMKPIFKAMSTKKDSKNGTFNSNEKDINMEESIVFDSKNKKKKKHKKEKLSESKDEQQNTELSSCKIDDNENLTLESENNQLGKYSNDFNYDSNDDVDIEEHKVVLPDDFKHVINNFGDNISTDKIDLDQSQSSKKTKKKKNKVKDKHLSAQDSDSNSINQDSTKNLNNDFSLDLKKYDNIETNDDMEVDDDKRAMSPSACKKLNQIQNTNLLEKNGTSSSDDDKDFITKKESKVKAKKNKVHSVAENKIDDEEIDRSMSTSEFQKVSTMKKLDLLNDNYSSSSSEDEKVPSKNKKVTQSIKIKTTKHETSDSKESDDDQRDKLTKSKSLEKLKSDNIRHQTSSSSSEDEEDSDKKKKDTKDLVNDQHDESLKLKSPTKSKSDNSKPQTSDDPKTEGEKRDVKKKNEKSKKNIIISETQESKSCEQNYLESQNIFSSSENIPKDLKDAEDEISKSEDDELAVVAEGRKANKPRTISELLETTSLADEVDCVSTTALIDFCPDDEDVNIFLLEVPKNIFNKNMINKKFEIKNDSVVIGNKEYNAIEKQPTPSLTCVFKSGRNSKNTFKPINFRPCAALVTKGIKLPDEKNKKTQKKTAKSPKPSKNNGASSNDKVDSPPTTASPNKRKITAGQSEVTTKKSPTKTKSPEKKSTKAAVSKTAKPPKSRFAIKNFVRKSSNRTLEPKPEKPKVAKVATKRKAEKPIEEQGDQEVVEKKEKKNSVKKSKKNDRAKESIEKELASSLGVSENFFNPRFDASISDDTRRYGVLNIERVPAMKKPEPNYDSSSSSDGGHAEFPRRSFKIQKHKDKSEDEKPSTSTKVGFKNTRVHFDE